LVLVRAVRLPLLLITWLSLAVVAVLVETQEALAAVPVVYYLAQHLYLELLPTQLLSVLVALVDQMVFLITVQMVLIQQHLV
jgi:hypothetical protein